jgi:hypothetical protein
LHLDELGAPTPTQVTRVGLDKLAQARPELRIYTYYGHRQGDRWKSVDFWYVSLSILEGQTSLRSVDLTKGQPRGKITGEELVHLKGLVNVEELSFRFEGVTDAALVNLKEMTKLKKLTIHFTPNITGSGLVHLQAMTGLEYLNLSDTCVTDAGLEHLKGLSNLRTLVLSHTQVTEEGVKTLQEALPDCAIWGWKT